MKFVFAAAFLVAAASALPLDFQPSVNVEHPAFSTDSKDLRLVGGQEVPPHAAPYQVGLFMGDRFCGGSLINDRYVLTSAQCAALSSRIVVILGAHRIKEKEKEQVTYVAAKVIVHPHWDKLQNDIALIMLPERVRPTNAISPIKLAPPEAGYYEGEQVRVTGWGTTSDNSNELSPILRYILNPIVKNKVCEQKLGVRMSNGQLCLSGENKRSPCLGDGGAPVVGVYQGDLVQVGFVSFMVEGGCERGYPVGLTRVGFYYQWILSNM